MSFGGLALGVGLIVDNAIVVLENIVRLRSQGRDRMQSSLVGTREVGGAIIASTLTTSVIFLPVVFMQTITGTLFQELAPETEADNVRIDFYLSEGLNITIANQYLEELETRVRAIAPLDQVKHVTTEVRNGRAEVELILKDVGERDISSYALADELREKLEGIIPGGSVRVRAQSGLWILRRVFGGGGGGEDEDEAGRLRLRPILMTTLTTVLGLLPLSFGWGAGGEIQAALARVVIGGLSASTLITLILIPVIYINVDKIIVWVKGMDLSLLWRRDDQPVPVVDAE